VSDVSIANPPASALLKSKKSKTVALGKGLTFCHVNINGIKSKIDEVREFLCTYHVGVMGLIESKLCPTDDYNFFRIENYTMFRRDRVREGGGTLIYISKSVKFVNIDLPIVLPFELEITVIRITYTGIKPILYVLLYNPPDHSTSKFLDTFRAVLVYLQTLGLEIIITSTSSNPTQTPLSYITSGVNSDLTSYYSERRVFELTYLSTLNHALTMYM
jgi:hypothetical protein